MSKSYIVFNPWFSKSIPIAVFNNKIKCIFFIRDMSASDYIIMSIETNSYDDNAKDVSEDIYDDAYNGFKHVRDTRGAS